LNTSDPVVYIVDDDVSIRKALRRLFQSTGLKVDVFSSAQEFLNFPRPDLPSCLVLDVNMPGLDGLELQEELTSKGIHIPIIFMTGYGNIPMTVKAMKAGAIDFLAKPFENQQLLDIVHEALEKDRQNRLHQYHKEELQNRYDNLTPREREVFTLVVSGMINKQIGMELKISEKTVKVHRARAMKKMNADSLAQLVQFAEKLKDS